MSETVKVAVLLFLALTVLGVNAFVLIAFRRRLKALRDRK